MGRLGRRSLVGWVASSVVVLASLAISGTLSLALDTSPWHLVSWLARHGSLLHGVIAGWLLAAPAVLLLAAVLRGRTPWPWVGATTLLLLALTVIVARFPHLFSTTSRALLAGLLVAALASVVSAFTAADEAREDQSV